MVKLLFFAFSLLFLATSGRELRNDYVRTRETTITAKMEQITERRTNYTDEQGLVEIYKKYTQMLDFNISGDPCLPTPLAWIECNSDANPRIIVLNLNNRQLSGEVPDFSSMDALHKIDLSENRFTGNIPSFLGSFPHLQELNLSFNLFNGSIPNSLAINKNVKISYSKFSNNISDGPLNFHSVSKQMIAPTGDYEPPPDDYEPPPPPPGDYESPPSPPPGDYESPPPPPDDYEPPPPPPDDYEPPPPDDYEPPPPDYESPPPPPPGEYESPPPPPPGEYESPPPPRPRPPPPPPPTDEPPHSNVPAIVGGSTAGGFVVLLSGGGFLYWLFGCCGGSERSLCAFCHCSICPGRG